MKILYLTNQLAMGGIETNLVRLARALASRGHEVLAASGPGSLADRFESAGGRHVLVDLTGLFARRADVETLREVIANEVPDVIHVMSASAALTLRRATFGATWRPPVVSSLMGLVNAPNEPKSVTLLRAWLTTLGADRLILIAPSFERLVRRLPVRRKRTVSGVVVGVGQHAAAATPAMRQRTRDELGIPEDGLLVTTIGALEPRKSHELFVQAAAEVLDIDPSVHFLVVGGGHLEMRLRREIESLGVSHRVRLLGERHDVDRILAASDLYVRPGTVEGFVGITVLEAQMLGVPVVSFDTQDVRMAIEDGVTGLLARNGDSRDLAEKITRILSDPGAADAIGAAGRRSTIERFEIGSVATWLETQYRDVIETTNRGR